MANPWEEYEGGQEPWSKYQPEPAKEPGLIEQGVEVFTGSARATPQTEALPELQDSGLLGGEDQAQVAAISPALLTATDPNEIVKIVTSNFPNIGVAYNLDAQGNPYPILRNNETGAVAQVNKPGLSGLDVMQGLGIASAFMPTGRVGSTLGTLGRVGAQSGVSGATSAAIEGAQKAVGGDFDIENVVIDMLAAGAFEAVPAYLQAAKQRAGEAAETATREAVEAEAIRAGQPLSPEAAARAQQETAGRLVGAAEAPTRQQGAAVREFAEEVVPDQEVIAASRELGVEDALLPSYYSTNPAYIEIEQGLASIPGSKLSVQQKEATRQVAQKADELITDFGGTTDKSGLSEKLKDTVLANIDELDEQAEAAYKSINEGIPETSLVNTDNVISAIMDEARKLGGVDKLDGVERGLLNKLGGSRVDFSFAGGSSKSPTATYALLDRERKKIGDALRKSAGPYKDASTGALKRLYGVLSEAQEKAAKDFGYDDVWEQAKSLVSMRKDLEDQSIKLLGRDKTGAIMPKVGQAVKKLSTGDYKAFDEIIGSIPKESREEVVLSSLNDAFTMGSRAEKQLSAPGFVDWMEGLNRNKAAKERIYKELPEGAAERLEALFKVSKGMRNAAKDKITTGRIVALLDNFANSDGMISKLYQTGKKVAVAEGATTAAGIPGAGATGVLVDSLSKSSKDPLVKAADDLLTSPEFLAATRAYADTSVRARAKQEAANAALMKSDRVKKWADMLPRDEYQRLMKSGLIAYLSGEE